LKKETMRNFLLWLIAFSLVSIAVFTVLMKLEPGFLLPSRFADNPKVFIASYVTVTLFIICSIGGLRAGLKMVKEIKEERDKIDKNIRR
jgi:hypothetical protein